MSARRCPHCGGLVASDLEWCGQCLTRLEEPDAVEERDEGGPSLNGDARPAVVQPSGAPSEGEAGRRLRRDARGRTETPNVRVDEGRILWVCPMCSDENPMGSQACTTCGTPFGRLFEEPGPPPRVSAGGAAALSLVFPGIGHVVARHAADGLARAVVFAFTLTMFVTILGSPSGGPLTPLLILFGMASALVYATTPADAARAVRGEPPILATRVLLIGATGLLAAATLVLVLGGPGLTGG